MVGYRGLALFDKSIGRKVTGKDVAKRLYKYADYPEAFADSNKIGYDMERYPETDDGNRNWKLDDFVIGGDYSGYLIGKKQDMKNVNVDKISEDILQVKDIPEDQLKNLWAHGLIDKYGVFTKRNDYCAWDSERKEDLCDRYRIENWDNFYDSFIKSLDPEDWIAVFNYHV